MMRIVDGEQLLERGVSRAGDLNGAQALGTNSEQCKKGMDSAYAGTIDDLECLPGIFNAPNNPREAPSLVDPPPHSPTSGRAIRARI
jgi:hypothetical protein